ncbi:hypothetical protein ABFS83_13G058900 [Erythranthe nasuta]
MDGTLLWGLIVGLWRNMTSAPYFFDFFSLSTPPSFAQPSGLQAPSLPQRREKRRTQLRRSCDRLSLKASTPPPPIADHRRLLKRTRRICPSFLTQIFPLQFLYIRICPLWDCIFSTICSILIRLIFSICSLCFWSILVFDSVDLTML